MNIQLEIEVPIKVSKHVRDIVFGDSLEIGLDCFGCKRCHRTVVLHECQSLSYCTPTKHKFEGNIVKISSTTIEGEVSKILGLMKKSKVVIGHYLVEYKYEHFEDIKHPERTPSTASKWARVKYTMRCKCGLSKSQEIQSNTVGRPFKVSCECGLLLSTEVANVPTITQRN